MLLIDHKTLIVSFVWKHPESGCQDSEVTNGLDPTDSAVQVSTITGALEESKAHREVSLLWEQDSESTWRNHAVHVIFPNTSLVSVAGQGLFSPGWSQLACQSMFS